MTSPVGALSRVFMSDTCSPVHRQVLNEISGANRTNPSYGEDAVSEDVREEVKRMFGLTARTLFVPSGHGSNALSMLILMSSGGNIIIAETGHMFAHEMETHMDLLVSDFFTVPTPNGKLTVELIEAERNSVMNAEESLTVSVSQPTELGTVYTREELMEIAAWCKNNDAFLHVDGARLGNALAYLGTSVREFFDGIAIDTLSFGFSKNGGLIGELVVVLSKDQDVIRQDYLNAQSTMAQMPAKTWAMAASVKGMLWRDLWLDSARRANYWAQELARGLVSVYGPDTLTQKVETNAVFCRLPRKVIDELHESYEFYIVGDVCRFMTTHATTEDDIRKFIACHREVRAAVVTAS